MMPRKSIRSARDYVSDDEKVLNSVFDKNERFLRRHLVLSSSVIGKLITAGVLSPQAQRKMKGESNENQVNILIEELRRSGMRVFQKFIEVLRTSMDSWVADVIFETNIADTVLSGKKYTLTQHMKTNSNDFANDLEMRNTETATLPRRNHEQFKREAMSNLSDMMATIKDINDRGNGMVSSHQLSRISSMFDKERQNQDSALALLQQEETELRELLEQNLREQTHTRRNQKSLLDINQKLRQITLETSQLSNSVPRTNMTRERLSQIQRISRSKPESYEHDYM